MIHKVWRGVRSDPPHDTRPDFYVITDTAEDAERRIRDKFSFREGETLAMTLFEEFEYPRPNCTHPPDHLIFWQYGPETRNTPRRLVRCYVCPGCGAHVHDDTTDRSMVPCDHKPHRPVPDESKVH